jgi:tetratricopeptide (TPR) repeat protein
MQLKSDADILFERARQEESPGLIKRWLHGEASLENAAATYLRAAGLYRLEKRFDFSGDSYLAAAECFKRLKKPAEASHAYLCASNVFRKTNRLHSRRCLQNCVSIYAAEGLFAIAAKHLSDMSEFAEAEGDIECALEYLIQAADFYEEDHIMVSVYKCREKIARYYALLENYFKAIATYESLMPDPSTNEMLTWLCRDYVSRAALCYLAAGNIAGCQSLLERYESGDPSFRSSPDHTLLSELISSIETKNLQRFVTAVQHYDSSLDTWKTTILLRLKQKLN